MSISWQLRLHSTRATERLGSQLARFMMGGEVVALIGDLGVGKTVLVRGIARGLALSPEQVTSPTFTLIHEYPGSVRLVHVDLYRIDDDTALRQLGLDEYYDEHTVVVVEWADRLASDLPPDHLAIRLEHVSLSTRRATITAHGPRSQKVLNQARASDRASRERGRARPNKDDVS